jgi:hypothetical protein
VSLAEAINPALIKIIRDSAIFLITVVIRYCINISFVAKVPMSCPVHAGILIVDAERCFHST